MRCRGSEEEGRERRRGRGWEGVQWGWKAGGEVEGNETWTKKEYSKVGVGWGEEKGEAESGREGGRRRRRGKWRVEEKDKRDKGIITKRQPLVSKYTCSASYYVECGFISRFWVIISTRCSFSSLVCFVKRFLPTRPMDRWYTRINFVWVAWSISSP